MAGVITINADPCAVAGVPQWIDCAGVSVLLQSQFAKSALDED